MRPGNYFRGAGTQNSIPVVFLDSLHRVSHSNTQVSPWLEGIAVIKMVVNTGRHSDRAFCNTAFLYQKSHMTPPGSELRSAMLKADTSLKLFSVTKIA